MLAVSTDLDILRTLSQALTLSGYAVTRAGDWSEAMERLRTQPLSVLLYDIKDLDRTEWNRLADLRKVHPDCAVVLLASLASNALDRALDEGLISGYLVKAFRLSGLEACLERVGAKG